MALLELRNVTKGFGKGAARADVLRDVNFEVEDGEFVAIVGYSGAGKTTLISLLAGLLKPETGSVVALGAPVTAPGPERGVVFQNYSLLPWLSVLDNVLLAVQQVFPTEDAARQRQRAFDAITKVNLSPAVHKKPSELSGGMRQRVSVARALAMNPQVLLLDEPLSALDALTRSTIQDEIVALWQREQKTIVLITNDVDEGLIMADRIIPLSAGPGARLGPSFKVQIERPRDRKALNHGPRFRAIRTEVIEWLLGPGKKHARPVSAPAKPKAMRHATDLSIGFLPLADAAPFVVATERGLFAKHGLNVRLRKLTAWTAAVDALSDGRLQAAQLPFGMPIASAVGLLGPRKPQLVIPWIASRNGQAITLASSYERKVGPNATALKPFIDERNAADRTPIFAVTHPHGTHAMWLRYWLGAGGIHPDVDVALTTVPPASMLASLRSGAIEGMSVGEPWNAAAIAEQCGYTAITSQEIWHDHPEKVCAFTETYANEHPNVVRAVCKALHEASVWLDEPANRAATAAMLSPPHYVNCAAATIEQRLSGRYDFGDGRRRDFGDLAMTFSRRNANFPQLKYVTWWLSQYRRWGMLDAQPDYDAVARRVARFDLYQEAMSEIGHRAFGEDHMPEILFDGHVFDPSDPEGYARSFRINTLSDIEPTTAATAGDEQ